MTRGASAAVAGLRRLVEAFSARGGVAAVAVVAGLVLASCMTASPTACLAPAAVADADLAAHRAALADESLCVSEQRFEENGVAWHLVTIRNTAASGPLWVVPHDDENAAFAASLYAVGRHGGTSVAVEADEQRSVGTIDPNRTFRPSRAGTTCAAAPSSFPRYARAVLAAWNRSFPVIGMHSNANGFGGGRGAGTISIRRADARSQPFAARGSGRLADEDTMVMIAGTVPAEDNPRAMAAVEWFNARGVNVLYNRIDADSGECSLADYMTLDRAGSYFGIEVQDGDTATAKALANLVMEFIDSPAYAGII